MHSPQNSGTFKRRVFAFFSVLVLTLGASQAAITLSRDFNVFSALDFTNSLVYFIKQFALIFFSFISLYTIFIKPNTVPQKAHLKPWLPFFSLLAAVFLFSNVINPRGTFNISFVPALENPSQSNKYRFYANLPHTPNLVIFGSSRVFIHSASYIKETLGYDTFNFGVANSSLLDALIQMRFIAATEDGQFPEVLLIETLPNLTSSKFNAATRSSFAMLPYMDLEMAGHFLGLKGSELISIYTFTEALYTWQFSQSNPDMRARWTFLPDGSGVRNSPNADPEFFQRMINGVDIFPTCKKHSDDSIDLLTAVIQFAYDRNSAVVIYTSPWQPDFYATFLETEPSFVRCQKLFLKRIADLQQIYPNLFFRDFTHIESFNGLSDHNGFYDSHHLTSANSDLLIAAAAPTIHEAYQYALNARKETR